MNGQWKLTTTREIGVGRVDRGGSYNYSGSSGPASDRNYDYRPRDILGFRVALYIGM